MKGAAGRGFIRIFVCLLENKKCCKIIHKGIIEMYLEWDGLRLKKNTYTHTEGRRKEVKKKGQLKDYLELCCILLYHIPFYFNVTAKRRKMNK